MKHKLLSILTALALCLTLLPATALAEGTGTAEDPWICGDGVTAVLSGNTLTISYTAPGSGAMANYNSASSVPWYGSKGSIYNVVIEEGVTSIGKNAFYYFNKLDQVVIPESVTSIGDRAFSGCNKLNSVNLPAGLTSIESETFLNCSALTSIEIPDSVRTIGGDAFNTTALTGVTIPEGVTSIGSYAFANSASLTTVEIPASVKTIGKGAFQGSTNAEILFKGTQDQWANAGGADSGASEDKLVINPHKVTIVGGGDRASGSGTYSEGAGVSIFAGTKDGYAFTGWEVEPENAELGRGFYPEEPETGFKMPGQDVILTATWAEAVAEVGGRNFADLQTAFDYATDPTYVGDTVTTLLKNVTVTELIRLTTGTVTLDGQGQTITGTDITTISVKGGSLTLKDVTVENTSEGQVLSAEYVMPGTAISVGEDGNLTVSDGATVRAAGKDGWAIYYSGGTVKIQGGTISGGKGFQFNTTGSFAAEKVSLTGGTFIGTTGDAIYVPYGFTLGQMLGEGLALINNETGAAVERTDVQTGPGAFTVEECRHKGAAGTSNRDGTHGVNCPYCGHTGMVEDCAYTFGGTATGTCAVCGDSVTVEVAGTENLAYTGSEMKPSVAVKRGETTLNVGKDYTVTYSDNINAGTAKVTVTIGTERGSYTGTFHIGPAKPAIAWAKDAEELTYTGRAAELKTRPTVTLAGSGEYDGEEIAYSYTKEGETAAQNGLPMNAGTYYIKAAVPEQNNYATAVTANTLTLTIKKVTTTVTPPAATRPAYNGTAQALVTAATTNAGPGAVQYALSKDGPWSTAIPTATDVGEYTVWYRVDETDNYTGVEARSVTAKIEKATVTAIGPSLMVKNNLEKTYTLDLRPYLPTLPQGQEYGELTYTLTEVYIGDSDYIAENTVNLVDTVLTVPVNKVDKTVEGSVAAITVTIQSDNFQDICLTVSVTATNKTPLIITGVTAQGWTYDGTVHPGYTGTPRAEGYTGEFQVYYLGYLANGKNRKDAGTFCVEFVPVGSGYAGELSLTYTVEPAQVTVKADDQTATVGDGMPELTWRVVSGLASGETLKTNPTPACDPDMSKAGTYPITISGGAVPDGGNYRAEIVYQSGTLTVSEKSAPTPPTGGDKPSQGDKPSGGSSSGGSGGSTPSTPPVTTGKTTEGSISVTETTAKPSATTRGNTASAAVSSSVGSEIVKQAEKNKSDNVVIAPEIRGDVTRTEVSIPAKTVEQISSKTQASLTVSTPVADVTVPNEALSGLSESGGSVKVMAERTGNTVELSVTAGGKAVDSVPGGVTVTVPVKEAKPGTVAVLVREDGTRQLIRKSIAGEAGMTVPLEGSAKIEIIDNSKTFDDVPAESWKADAAAFASARELFHGTAPGQFSPDIPMSRGMLAVVLHNLESNPNAALTGVFTDVDNRQWYAEGVAWAAANGIVSGYGSGHFGPDDPITREQLAVILWRYAGRPAATEKELSFTDAGQASGYALDALRWAVENGIINGKSGSTLDPKGPTTRAEAAQMLKNFLGK